jgi:putative MATE family efflux protein
MSSSAPGVQDGRGGAATSRPGWRWRPGADDRRIAQLALPALGALAAEPLYVLADTAIVGHLGVSPLAALALAGGAISSVVGLFSFLTFGSTTMVGRLFAVGKRDAAGHLGRQAALLAAAIGVILTLIAIAAAPAAIHLFGGHGQVGRFAVRYVRIAALGFPCALIALASQGYLRGVARLRLPLLVLLAANLINLALELWFVDELKWGIAGSAWGTVIAQLSMAAAFIIVLARAPSSGPLIDLTALRSLASTGAQILVRSASLSAAFLLASVLLAHVGSASLAAHQIAFQLWYFLALALSALAIAAQVLVSHHLAIGDINRARQLAKRTMIWSFIVGCCFAIALFAAGHVLPELFTQSPPVINRARAVWPIFALMQPFNALAFVLDGILLGAGDTRFCMCAMPAATAIGFAPLAILSTLFGWGIVGIWLALCGLIVARLVLYMPRFHGETWADPDPERAAGSARGTRCFAS